MADSTRLSEIDDLELELEALTSNLLAESPDYYITQRQVTSLASLMSSGLEDSSRGTRIRVLRLLAQPAVMKRHGLKIKTTKQIPGQMASVIIDLLKKNKSWELSDYGRELLHLAEKRTKTKAY